jgi:hypothetical protein
MLASLVLGWDCPMYGVTRCMGCGGIWVNVLDAEATALAGYPSARHTRDMSPAITRFTLQARTSRKKLSCLGLLF